MFKIKVRAKVTVVSLLVLLLAIPFPVFAEKKLEPITNLKFSDVEPLMMARYQVILDNVKTYSNANTGQDSIQTGTNNIQGLLVTLAGISSADPAVNSLVGVVAGLLNSQFQIAVGQNSMAQRTSITDIGLQTQQGNYTIVWNMEAMYITYNSLQQQIEDMKAKKTLLEKQLHVAKIQREIGMATETTILNAESQLTELESGMQQLEEAKKAIKETFNVNLAQKYDTDINISEVPDVTSEQIAAIKVDDDYTEAIKKSYGVQLNDSDIDKENDAKRNFEKGFYRAYQTILDKQKTLEAEKLKFASAKKNFTIAELKYKLGMLSTIQYQAEYSAYITKKMALAKAEDTLFQAYQAYQWAKRGLIVSTGSAS